MTNLVTRKDLSKGMFFSMAVVRLNGMMLIVDVVKRIDDENVKIAEMCCIEYAENLRQAKQRMTEINQEQLDAEGKEVVANAVPGDIIIFDAGVESEAIYQEVDPNGRGIIAKLDDLTICVLYNTILGTKKQAQETTTPEPVQTQEATAEQYDDDAWFAEKVQRDMEELQANRVAHAQAYGFIPQEGDICINAPYASVENYQEFSLFRYESGLWVYHTSMQVGIDRYLSQQGYKLIVKFGKYAEGYYSQHEALAQPDVQQVQQNLIKFFQAAYDYCYTIVPDYLPQPHEYIYGSPYRPMSPSWARIPDAHYVQVDWHTEHVYTWVVVPQPLDAKTIASYELKLVKVPEVLQVAWDALQAVPSYVERKLEDDRTSEELWHDMEALRVKIAQELAVAEKGEHLQC